MNCDDFMERLQQQIDDRGCVEQDGPLQSHARKCDLCRGQLFAWQQINQMLRNDSISPPSFDSSRKRPGTRFAVTCAATAATVLFCLSLLNLKTRQNVPLAMGPVAMSNAAAPVRQPVPPVALPHPQPVATAQSRIVPEPSAQVKVQGIDVAHWFQGVQKQDWLEQTMPTVQSLRKGVAPLGRSLLRAVTILTTGDPGQTT